MYRNRAFAYRAFGPIWPNPLIAGMRARMYVIELQDIAAAQAWIGILAQIAVLEEADQFDALARIGIAAIMEVVEEPDTTAFQAVVGLWARLFAIDEPDLVSAFAKVIQVFAQAGGQKGPEIAAGELSRPDEVHGQPTDDQLTGGVPSADLTARQEQVSADGQFDGAEVSGAQADGRVEGQTDRPHDVAGQQNEPQIE